MVEFHVLEAQRGGGKAGVGFTAEMFCTWGSPGACHVADPT